MMSNIKTDHSQCLNFPAAGMGAFFRMTNEFCNDLDEMFIISTSLLELCNPVGNVHCDNV